MKNIKIAVTGGIGSGKSTVLKMISDLGYPVVSCDKVYADLLLDEAFVRLVSDEMGVLPLFSSGRLILDRKSIAKIVFNDELMLKKLNRVTHNAIFQKAFSLYDGKTRHLSILGLFSSLKMITKMALMLYFCLESRQNFWIFLHPRIDSESGWRSERA